MCVHSKVLAKYDLNGGTLPTYQVNWPANDSYFITANHHLFAAGNHPQAVTAAKTAFGVNLGTGVLGAGGQGFINQAAEKLRPDLTTVSLPNFLLEIDDITRLWQLWKKDLSLAKNLAGLKLTYNFGLKPLIGDLAAIVGSLRSLKEKLAAFEKSLNTLFHGSTTVLSDTTSKSGTFVTGTYNTCTWHGTVKRTVTAHIVWRPQPLQIVGALDKVVRGLLDTFGFELNPRIIWDALPFTFVIDWFFDVGSFLGRYRVDALELPIMYVDSYLQYKEELTIESFTRVNATSAGFSPPISSGGWVTTEKLFQRMPLFPDYSVLTGLGWKFPSLNQAVLGVALATVLK
jgi:hypothetical protein